MANEEIALHSHCGRSVCKGCFATVLHTQEGPITPGVVFGAVVAVSASDSRMHRVPEISPLRQAEMSERAQGCLRGQLTGDALGSLVEIPLLIIGLP